MVEGWGDVYLCKGWKCKQPYGYEEMTREEIEETFGDVFSLEDDAYYLADCRICLEKERYIKVSR